MDTRMTCHDKVRDQLANANLLLDKSLQAIHLGQKLDAMEAVYSVSCLLEDILDALPERTS